MVASLERAVDCGGRLDRQDGRSNRGRRDPQIHHLASPPFGDAAGSIGREAIRNDYLGEAGDRFQSRFQRPRPKIRVRMWTLQGYGGTTACYGVDGAAVDIEPPLRASRFDVCSPGLSRLSSDRGSTVIFGEGGPGTESLKAVA